MSTISFKLPEQLVAQLDAEAERQGESKSAVVREALAQYLSGAPARGVRFLDLAGDAIGSIEGPGDLSTNNDYMRGYGE